MSIVVACLDWHLVLQRLPLSGPPCHQKPQRRHCYRQLLPESQLQLKRQLSRLIGLAAVTAMGITAVAGIIVVGAGVAYAGAIGGAA